MAAAVLVALLAALAVAVSGSRGGPDGDAGDRSATTTTVRSPPPGAPPASQPAAAPSPAASALVDTLAVAEPDPGLPRYERDRFGGDWDYDPSTGCNTRELVLIEESLVPPVVDDRCRSTAGRWTSTYDGLETTDVADLEIDHLVPLADAWRSGASSWTDERRRAFANDLDDPGTLVAVSSRSNRSKSDSTPDEWLPPDRTSWCTYATDWVAVKATWQLTVTPAEKATLVQVLAGC